MDLDVDDLLEDVDKTFDARELKSVMELAMRMTEVMKSTSAQAYVLKQAISKWEEH